MCFGPMRWQRVVQQSLSQTENVAVVPADDDVRGWKLAGVAQVVGEFRPIFIGVACVDVETETLSERLQCLTFPVAMFRLVRREQETVRSGGAAASLERQEREETLPSLA